MSKGKLFLIGGFLLVLLAVPITVLYLQQQTSTQSGAAKSTTLSFAPTNPFNVGDPVKVGVYLTPNSNVVSFVKLSITFDSSKLSASSSSVMTDYTQAFPSTLDAPKMTCGSTICTVTVTMSIGSTGQPVKGASQQLIATLNFTAAASTDTNLTPILRFDQSNTQVLSIASSDQPAENVLASANDASIVINPVPTATPGPTLTITPTIVPTTSVTNTNTGNTTSGSTSNTGGTTTTNASGSANATPTTAAASGNTRSTLTPTGMKSIPSTGPSSILIGTGIIGTVVTIGGLLLLAL